MTYIIDVPSTITIDTEKNSFIRIIDNLVSNASKYNKPKGEVKVVFDASTKTLIIRDKGKGIKNPKRVFERFYKEHERGLGIGLHIVEKLCKQLNINIEIKSVLDEGTDVKLGLKKIVEKL